MGCVLVSPLFTVMMFTASFLDYDNPIIEETYAVEQIEKLTSQSFINLK
jgi:hypothetical protein